MWSMKSHNRALKKLARFKIISLGELPWVWQRHVPQSWETFGFHERWAQWDISQLLSRLTAFPSSLLFVGSVSWLSGRGQVDSCLFIYSIHSVINSKLVYWVSVLYQALLQRCQDVGVDNTQSLLSWSLYCSEKRNNQSIKSYNEMSKWGKKKSYKRLDSAWKETVLYRARKRFSLSGNIYAMIWIRG